MTQVPQKPLIPNNTLITKTAEEGRALAVMLARNSIHAMQGELEKLRRLLGHAHDTQRLAYARRRAIDAGHRSPLRRD